MKRYGTTRIGYGQERHNIDLLRRSNGLVGHNHHFTQHEISSINPRRFEHIDDLMENFGDDHRWRVDNHKLQIAAHFEEILGAVGQVITDYAYGRTEVPSGMREDPEPAAFTDGGVKPPSPLYPISTVAAFTQGTATKYYDHVTADAALRQQRHQ